MKNYSKLMVFLLLLFTIKIEAQPTKVLILMPDKYGANYYLNRDDMENFGWEIKTAGVSSTVNPCQDYAGPLGCPAVTVDVLVSQIQNIKNYDILVISSGGGGNNSCANLINSPATLQLVRDAVDSGLIVGAMCSGVRVLAAAGVLSGIHVTSNLHDSVYCINAGAIHVGICAPPVIDGKIVTTSIGDYYHHQNTEALMRTFCANKKKLLSEKSFKGLLSNSTFLKIHKSASDTMEIITFGDTLAEGGRALYKTSDGGFLISGFTFSSGQGYSDALLLKINGDGNQQWIKTVGGPLPDYANSCLETSDGHYLVCGYTYSSGAGDADVLVFKTDTLGNMIWSKTFGGTGFETGKSICETSDGKYLVFGYTESYGNGIDDEYLLKLDTAGNLIWQKTFGNIESDMGNFVIESSDGDYILAGNAGNRTINLLLGWWGDRDASLRKVDTNGNLIWEKRYNFSTSQQWGNAVTETFDHDFMIAGNNDITNSELLNVYLIKSDSAGVKKWTRSFGEGTYYDYGNSISPTSDSCFLICGTTKSIPNGNDVYLIKVNKNGSLMEKQIIGEEGFDWGNAVISSGINYIVTGMTNSYGSVNYDILFIKIINDWPAIINSDNGQRQTTRILSCSPNPFSGILSVKLFISDNDPSRLEVTDLYGRIISNYRELVPGNQVLIWDGRDNSKKLVPSGMYFINLHSKSGIQTRKVIFIQ